MKPIAWVRPCESEGAVLEWDKPHPSDCADPSPLYHGSDVDARIAELAAEVERYKADANRLGDALNEIADHCIASKGTSGDDATRFIYIARNALREGE